MVFEWKSTNEIRSTKRIQYLCTNARTLGKQNVGIFQILPSSAAAIDLVERAGKRVGCIIQMRFHCQCKITWKAIAFRKLRSTFTLRHTACICIHTYFILFRAEKTSNAYQNYCSHPTKQTHPPVDPQM